MEKIRTLEENLVSLNGMRIMDRQRDTTIQAEKKIGRNQLVTIKKGSAVKIMKYKKAHNLLKQGWTIND